MTNYQLPITNPVERSIDNLVGQSVGTLVPENQKAGYHRVTWDTRDLPLESTTTVSRRGNLCLLCVFVVNNLSIFIVLYNIFCILQMLTWTMTSQTKHFLK
jgi:hypothetical protein